jgi:blue copper oxidase
MSDSTISRRDLLLIGAAGAAGAALNAVQGLGRPFAWADLGPAPAPGRAPDVELELTARVDRVSILPGQPTEVWRFSGRVITGPPSSLQQIPDSYLGPVIRLRRGQVVRIRFRNQLPDPSIVHWHGLDVPELADGHPRLAVAGGAEYTYDFTVENRAGTYWYHPHPHMETGPQVYSGLAGLLLVTDDDEAALGLPAGERELPCLIQDRRFDGANQLVYSTTMMDMETGFLGDRVLVNGKPTPVMEVAAGVHRLRVLNGSNARIYKLEWHDGTPLTVLGTDGGLLERPLTQRFMTLAPGQRADLWVDLSGRPVGARLELRSAAFELGDAGLDMGGMGRGMGGRGMGMGAGGAAGGGARGGGRGAALSGGGLPLGAPVALMTLSVARAGAAREPSLPARLSTFDRTWTPVADAPVRTVGLNFQAMEWTLGGRPFDMADVAADETVQAGSTHLWDIANQGGPMGMQMAHPIHIHGRQFRVIRRSGGSATNTLRDGLVDSGWMDTVLVLPGETVRVQVTFGQHTGLFLYHCHILEHEDMGMMRNFRIVPRR